MTNVADKGLLWQMLQISESEMLQMNSVFRAHVADVADKTRKKGFPGFAQKYISQERGARGKKYIFQSATSPRFYLQHLQHLQHERRKREEVQ